MYCEHTNVEILLDGAASPLEKRAIENHLSVCQACTAYLTRMQEVRTLLQKGVVPLPSDSLDRQVMLAFRHRHWPPRAGTPWWHGFFEVMSVSKAVVATSVVCICAALLIGFWIGRISARQFVVRAPESKVEGHKTFPPSAVEDGGSHTSASAELSPVKKVVISQRQARAFVRKRSRSESENSLESFTLVTPTSANYSTNATLAGFEPITATKVRVLSAIDGGEQR